MGVPNVFLIFILSDADGCLGFILPTLLLLSAELPVLIVNHPVSAESRQNTFKN